MRIGFLCALDPTDPTVLSGTPWHMLRALEARGHRVTPICPPEVRREGQRRALRTAVAGRVPAPLRSGLRRLKPLASGLRSRLRRAPTDPGQPEPDDGEALLAEAGRTAEAIARQVDPSAFDLLFAPCISVPLYRLSTSLPVVYYSDTTAHLINTSYGDYAERSPAYHRATDAVERESLGRAQATVFATELARRSAVERYGVPAARASVVRLGTNIDPGEVAWSPPAPPTRTSLRLVTVAADPVRKQLDLVVEAVERLRAAGVSATLDAVGRTTPRAEASPWVRCAGFLRHSVPAERRRLLEALAASHVLVLPSLAEAFGIAPGEAARFGRPSVVSDAGGLPEAVLDGETGVVLPVAAGAQDYADALAALVDDPARYERLAAAAHTRAEAELRWDRWAEALDRVFAEVTGA